MSASVLPIEPLKPDIFWRIKQRRIRELSDAALRQSAVVFAPHPDDEALGCGGTIARKVAVGAPVSVVFMTDGRTSHQHLIPAELIIGLRKAEARASCQRLGVNAGDVHALNYPDARLNEHRQSALEDVRGLLRQRRPESVFVPYRHDVTPDHVTTTQIVFDALRAEKMSVDVYEYPVWVWHHFPWMTMPLRPRYQARQYMLNTLRSVFGLRMLYRFNVGVDVRDYFPMKRAALMEHKTQMTRLIDDPAWLTLGDVAGGRFLSCFFRDFELFDHTTMESDA